MAFVSAVVGRVTSINLAEFGAALLAYPRCMAPSDTLLVGSRPSAAGALVQAPPSQGGARRIPLRPGDGVLRG